MNLNICYSPFNLKFTINKYLNSWTDLHSKYIIIKSEKQIKFNYSKHLVFNFLFIC